MSAASQQELTWSPKGPLMSEQGKGSARAWAASMFRVPMTRRERRWSGTSASPKPGVAYAQESPFSLMQNMKTCAKRSKRTLEQSSS